MQVSDQRTVPAVAGRTSAAPEHPPAASANGSRLLVGAWVLAIGLTVTASEPFSEPPAPLAAVVAERVDTSDASWASHSVPEAERRRALDCDLPTPSGQSPDDVTRVWSGLVAARCGQTEAAARVLARAAHELGDLDHWRFVVRVESEFDNGDVPELDAGLEAALASRPAWVRRELEVPWARHLAEHDRQTFWRLYRPRLTAVDEPAATELDAIAWSLAEQGSSGDREQIAIRLLVHSPVQASVLQVVEVLRREDGSIDWRGRLGTELLLLRARNLIDAGITEGALAALDEVEAADRRTHWKLTRARALTLNREGAEAWAILAGVTAEGFADELELAWARAEAALDAAQVRRGRDNLDSTTRAVMRARGHQQLDLIATRSLDPEERADALRRRVADLNNDDSATEVTALARALAELDPEDHSAEPWMWAQGWKQYQARNWTGAIGWWRHLLDIYPHGRETERARYWSGRAYQRLGDHERAAELWRRVAASPIDHLYARRARERLAEEVAAASERFADLEPPSEARLGLATWMIDAGLPELARREAARQALDRPSDADHVLAARIDSALGDRRQAIVSIWRAYPQLGTPQEVHAPRFAHEIYYPRAFEQEVRDNARLAGLDPTLVWAIIRQESAFDPHARSRSGARGLMQLMPPTGREQAGKLGMRYSLSSLNEPAYNIRLGSSYFRLVLDMFDGNLELALAGYNSGPFRMRRMVGEEGSSLQLDEFIEELPWSETRTYVRRIVQFRDSFATLYPDAQRSG